MNVRSSVGAGVRPLVGWTFALGVGVSQSVSWLVFSWAERGWIDTKAHEGGTKWWKWRKERRKWKMGRRNEERGVGKEKGGKTQMIGAQPVAPFVARPGRLLIWAVPHTRQMQHYVCSLCLWDAANVAIISMIWWWGRCPATQWITG